jgi:subfamily B ATP-binding cassette protein MsbA
MLTRVFSSLFLMGVLVTLSWKLSIIAISILLLVLLPSTQIRKMIKKLVHASEDANSNVMAFFTETVGGARVINGYTIARIREKQFLKAQKALTETSIKATQVKGWLTPSMHIISAIGIALIVWQGSKMVITGELTNGGFASFIVSMLMLYNPIKNLGNSIMTAQMSLIAADRIFRRLDMVPEIMNKPDAVPLKEIKKNIEFRDVTFSYDGEKTVLEDMNLEFPKGKTVALVGASGGGKSTIANLIPRFYDVQSGAVLVDGIDIRNVTLASLRQKIAIVNQENFLFSATIRENLLVGNSKATETQLYDALEKAYLTELVTSLPQGLDTEIGERGALLSGGQRQRLAIARAILKDAPVVIPDEATSALDNESEAIVLKAMEALTENRTVIVIAHRLSTIRNADKVVVIDAGRVVEEGTHEALLTAKGAYSRLYNTQFQPKSDQSPESVHNKEEFKRLNAFVPDLVTE